MRLAPLALLSALTLGFTDCGKPDQIYCGKLLCDADQYCLQVYGGQPDSGFAEEEPTCADPPEDCGGSPSCDCLPDCTSCTEGDEGDVHCVIALP